MPGGKHQASANQGGPRAARAAESAAWPSLPLTLPARKTAEIIVEADTYQITVEPGITITAPRTTSSDIRRHKASNYVLPISSPS
jgi:hypothetical protein